MLLEVTCQVSRTLMISRVYLIVVARLWQRPENCHSGQEQGRASGAGASCWSIEAGVHCFIFNVNQAPGKA